MTTLLVRTGLEMPDGRPDSLGPAYLTSLPAASYDSLHTLLRAHTPHLITAWRRASLANTLTNRPTENDNTSTTSTLNLSSHPSTAQVLAAYKMNLATPTDALGSLPFASLSAAYTSDCDLIERYITSMLSAHLASPSPGYVDGSPNLVFVAEDVMRLLREVRRPQSAWLRCRTRVGELCWAVLVAVKVRRMVLEKAEWVRGLMGWVEFEKAVKGLGDEIGRESRGV